MPNNVSSDPEANAHYHHNDDYVYRLVAELFDVLHVMFSRSGWNGSQIERLEASAVVGANSLFVRLDTRGNRHEFVIEGECEDGAMDRRLVKLDLTSIPDITDRTIAWIGLVNVALKAVRDGLRLPFPVPSDAVSDEDRQMEPQPDGAA